MWGVSPGSPQTWFPLGALSSRFRNRSSSQTGAPSGFILILLTSSAILSSVSSWCEVCVCVCVCVCVRERERESAERPFPFFLALFGSFLMSPPQACSPKREFWKMTPRSGPCAQRFSVMRALLQGLGCWGFGYHDSRGCRQGFSPLGPISILLFWGVTGKASCTIGVGGWG